jgi:hypothetical protein
MNFGLLRGKPQFGFVLIFFFILSIKQQCGFQLPVNQIAKQKGGDYPAYSGAVNQSVNKKTDEYETRNKKEKSEF